MLKRLLSGLFALLLFFGGLGLAAGVAGCDSDVEDAAEELND